METENLKITNTLNDIQKREVASLYYKAFPKKFHALWIFTKTETQAVAILYKSLRYKKGIYVLKEDKVLGFIGLEKGDGYFAPLDYASFREAFHMPGASWRYLAYGIYRLFHGKTEADAIHIDPIVVSQQARGKGIGSRLLETTFRYGKALGKNKVILEVVDTNPMAKKLYERLGFRVVKEENISCLSRRTGFNKVYHMIKDLK